MLYKFLNNLKTSVLMAALMGLVMGIGYFIGGPGAVLPAFFIAAILNVGAYFFSDKLALATMRAKPVDRRDDPELYDLVEELASRADIPVPRVYISPVRAPNAFATGRNPRHGVVCVTQGLRSLLNREELAGVIAHELSHIKHRDILISTIVSIVAAAVTYLSYLAFFFGGDDDDSPLTGLLLMILAPLAAGLIQMAISRSREYEADRSGAEIAGSPRGLVSSLKKMEQAAKTAQLRIPESQKNMFIVEPFTGKKMAKLFMTHPPTEDRIARLNQIRLKTP
jgi:heat shock protein HtpX